MDKIQKHENLCDQIHKTYIDKNHDYGDSFGKSIEEFGPIAGIVRMEDKFNRIKSLIKKGGDQKVTDESIEDTLFDLANYAIMLAMELGDEAEKTEEICDIARFADVIEREFIEFLIEAKYPDGITNVTFSYKPDYYSEANWIVMKDCSAMKVKIPSIERLHTLSADERKKQYELSVKWITPC